MTCCPPIPVHPFTGCLCSPMDLFARGSERGRGKQKSPQRGQPSAACNWSRAALQLGCTQVPTMLHGRLFWQHGRLFLHWSPCSARYASWRRCKPFGSCALRMLGRTAQRDSHQLLTTIKPSRRAKVRMVSLYQALPYLLLGNAPWETRDSCRKHKK